MFFCGDILALANVASKSGKEKVVCLLGTIGYGKTSLLYLLAGFPTPTVEGLSRRCRHGAVS